MANATIQFTQGLTVVPAGQSAVGFVSGTNVTLTDAGGAGATSYSWQVISYPGPLSSAPTITNPTSQIATVNGPFQDGVYIVKLIRTDGVSGTTADIKFFGVADADGLHLPSAGMTGTMSNIGGLTEAQAAGWAGRQSAYNVFLDAYLRWLKNRAGIWDGNVVSSTINNASSSPGLFSPITGKSGLFNVSYTRTSGAFILQLDDTSLLGISNGQVARFMVTMNTGTSNLSFRSGANPVLFTLTAPAIGSLTYHLEFVYTGTQWLLVEIDLPDQRVLNTSKEFIAVAGTQATSLDSYQRVGAVQIDPSKFPTAQIKFQAVLEASAGQTAVAQLYNVTDGGPVAGSTLTGPAGNSTLQEATVTLPSALKLYEVQLKLGAPNAGTDRAAVISAKVLLTWGS